LFLSLGYPIASEINNKILKSANSFDNCHETENSVSFDHFLFVNWSASSLPAVLGERRALNRNRSRKVHAENR